MASFFFLVADLLIADVIVLLLLLLAMIGLLADVMEAVLGSICKELLMAAAAGGKLTVGSDGVGRELPLVFALLATELMVDNMDDEVADATSVG